MDAVADQVGVEDGVSENVMDGLRVGEAVDVVVKDGVAVFVAVNEGDMLSEHVCVGVGETVGDTVVEMLPLGVLVNEQV